LLLSDWTAKILSSERREIHYVCDSGRVEGLILDKDDQEDEQDDHVVRGERRIGIVS